MLHPFMPYITEEIWQALVNDGTAIMVQDYPVYDGKLEFADEEATFEKIIAGIKSIRNCRGEMNVPPSVKAKLYIETAQPEVFSQGVMHLRSSLQISARKRIAPPLLQTVQDFSFRLRIS